MSPATTNPASLPTAASIKPGSTKKPGKKRVTHLPTKLTLHYFKKKWAHALPLYVEKDFSFRSGRQDSWTFKGNAILK